MAKKHDRIITFAQQDRKKLVYDTFSIVFIVACFFCISQPMYDIPIKLLFPQQNYNSFINCIRIILTYIYKGIGVYFPFLIYNIIKTKKTGQFFHKKPRVKPLIIILSILSVALIALSVQYFSSLIVSDIRSRGYIITEQIPYINSDRFSIIFFVIVAALVPSFFEEITFRGILMSNISDKTGAWSIFITSFVCACSHISLQQIIHVFIINIILSWIYYRTECLWLSYAVNSISNGVIAYFYTLSLYNKGMYERLNIKSYIVLFLAGAVLLCCLVFLIIKNTSKKKDKIFTDKECARGIFLSLFLWILIIATSLRIFINIVKPKQGNETEIKTEQRDVYDIYENDMLN